MSENSIITDELRKMIGMTLEPVVYHIEQGAIQRYANAIDDPNPIFNDIGYAKKSDSGRLMCPPGFLGWPCKPFDMLALSSAMIKAGAPPNILDGSIEYEFFQPIGANDILTCLSKVAKINAREMSDGIMLFTNIEQRYFNQDGDIVCLARQTIIYR